VVKGLRELRVHKEPQEKQVLKVDKGLKELKVHREYKGSQVIQGLKVHKVLRDLKD